LDDNAAVQLIVRPPGPALRQALSEHPERDRIDPAIAAREHADYVRAIRAAGVAVTVLPMEPELPDACFTWDTVLAFPQLDGQGTALLVAAQPGAPSRRPEVASVLECARHIAPEAEVVRIAEPGTLDGGDVITYGRQVAIGVSARTNEAGAQQLVVAVSRHGYRGALCPVDERLHLASAVTPLRTNRLIGTAAGYRSLAAGGLVNEVERLVIDDADVAAANVLAAGGRCFVASGFPNAVAIMRAAGETVVEVELDEFLRADGGPTCLVAPIY
jgi:dimethylargininase